MAVDYTKFKTPYYNIEVGDPSWKNVVKLPEWLFRRITKVEIQEAFHTPDNPGTTQLTISFTEGFDNDPGIITDLVFDGKQGITSLSEDGKKKENLSPKFLFQERNLVKVTWGYLEDRESSRSYMAQIFQATTTFSDSTSTSTTITCLPWTWIGDQLSTKNGRQFGTKTVTSKAGDSLVAFEDLKTDALVRKLADDLDMTTIVSKNLLSATVDKHKIKMWVSGQSFHQFMTRLADTSGCVYGIEYNPKTGKNVIIFITKQDFEKRVVIPDVNLLWWKQPGSILKSINLNCNFGGLTDNSQKSVNEKGEEITNKKTSQQHIVQFRNTINGKKQEVIDTDPTNVNPSRPAINLGKVANGGTIAGKSEINPAQNKEDQDDKANIKKAFTPAIVTLDFTTVGFTGLTPGITQISGIGLRYSGKYRIMTVTHTIDSNGYTTKCSAMSQVITGGGITPTNITQGQETEQKVDVKQFDQRKSDEPLAQLRELQGIPYV